MERGQQCTDHLGRYLTLGIALFLLSACGGGPDRRNDLGSPQLDFVPAAISQSINPELTRISRLEDLRSTGDGELIAFLDHERIRVRVHAARALGRLPHPEFGLEVTEALCRSLEDSDIDVRAEAAFALGVRADPSSAGVLLTHWRDASPLVRGRVVAAAARVADEAIRAETLVSMQDPVLSVRIEALSATALWDTESPDADEIDSALLNAISTRPAGFGQEVEPEPELVRCAIFALQRRRAEKGRGAFLEHLSAEDPEIRIFSARGLARIPASPEGTAALIQAMSDGDWRVAVEAARGLGESRDKSACSALVKAVNHPSTQVRRVALVALRNFPAVGDEVLPSAWGGTQDVAPSVRAEALITLARLLPKDEAVRLLRERVDAADPIERAGVARAAGSLVSFQALPILEVLAHDEDLAVAGAALTELGKVNSPTARNLLVDFLSVADNGLRLASCLALEENARSSEIPALVRLLETSEGDIAGEIAFNTLRLLAKLGGEQAHAAIRKALEHPNAFVRQVAREVWAPPAGESPPIPPRPMREKLEDVPVIGDGIPAWKRNPVAEVITPHGSMFFELFPLEAPRHVINFVRLVESDHYDGLLFHRVAPDFVIQGGDYRGDGNGGVSWRGGSLRHEFTPRKYVRGSLGMPRNEDPDSGGSQFFVTHRSTPHLDGRYTIFGELRQGFDVLDLVDVGDRILDVQLMY